MGQLYSPFAGLFILALSVLTTLSPREIKIRVTMQRGKYPRTAFEDLVTTTCYDSNQKAIVLAFSVARTEDATIWEGFLDRTVSAMQGIRFIMSDGAKVLRDIEVQMTQHSFQIAYVGCA